MIVATIAATILSAALYRLGGMSKQQASQDVPWVPLFLVNTKARDIGCALVGFVWMISMATTVAWWVHLISFLIMFGLLTTYWDKMFGHDNFYMHGAMVAMAYLPYVFVTGVWVGFAIRVLVVGGFMGLWCKLFGNDYVEEFGRGGIIALTLPLMLL